MNSNTYNSTSSGLSSAPIVEKVRLPTQVIEKPIAIHEEIRQERVEEIQPVINVEKLQTEVHQVTQPLIDKEIKPVNIQQRTLATEVLPEVRLAGRGVAAASDVSTVQYKDSAAVVFEKPAILMETDKLQIIEEIQPVLYKETVVPHVIQETKPIYQKIVEGPVYTQQTLPPKQYHAAPIVAPVVAPVVVKEVPVVEKPKLAEVETKTTTTTTVTTAAPQLPTYAL